MSKVWHWTGTGEETSETSTALGLVLATGTTTILRTLVNFQANGGKVTRLPLNPVHMPTLGLVIGYDSASSHSGEVMTPDLNPGYDYLYWEEFQPSFFQAPDEHGVPEYVYWAGTNGTRSVEGQRRVFSPNHNPFVQFYIRNVTLNPDDNVDWWWTVEVRFLCEV